MRSLSARLAAFTLLVAVHPAGLAQTAGAPSTPVSIALPEATAATRSLDLSGSFVARRAARLSPRLSGLVIEASVDAGDAVAAGDVVMRLDPKLAELAVAEAEAASTEAGARLTEALRLAAEARRLAADRFVAETQIAAREAEAGIAEAGLAVARATLATAQERLDRHAVIAPFDGVIAERFAEAGEWVQTGTPVLTLVDPDELWLDARAPQAFWVALGGSVTATVEVDALEMLLDAEVHARVPVNDPGARTFLVRLTVPEQPPALLPGMSANVRLKWQEDREVVYVPRDAIIRFPDGTTTVWVVDSTGSATTVREIPVTIERYDGDRAAISSGLSATQPVVVRGNEVLVEGQRVTIREGP